MDVTECLHRFVGRERILSQMELRRMRSYHSARTQIRSSFGHLADIVVALVAAADRDAVLDTAD